MLEDEINRYTDAELVQVAWQEFAYWSAAPEIKAMVERDIREAEQQRLEEQVLTPEGRGRLRKFILTKRRHDERAG